VVESIGVVVSCEVRTERADVVVGVSWDYCLLVPIGVLEGGVDK
jgi:hypothetical protein